VYYASDTVLLTTPNSASFEDFADVCWGFLSYGIRRCVNGQTLAIVSMEGSDL